MNNYKKNNNNNTATAAHLQVNLLTTKFGFDDAFNYKKELDLDAALKRFTKPSNLYLCFTSILYVHTVQGYSIYERLFSFN